MCKPASRILDLCGCERTFWFPRAGVGTDSGRAGIPFFLGTDFLVPTRRRGNRFGTRRHPVFFWFPRAGVGTDSGRAGIPFLRACGPLCCNKENAFPRRRVGTRNAFPRRRVGTRNEKCIPTPARGNEKRILEGIYKPSTSQGFTGPPSKFKVGKTCPYIRLID